MNEQFDAYAAGLIDGEGCLSLSKSLTPSIAVGMTKTAKNLLAMMQAEYGGTVRLHRQATEKWAEAWTWQTNGQECLALAERIAPHVQIKYDQCRLLLRFKAIRDENLSTPTSQKVRWTEDGRQRAIAIRKRILELNAKGPEAETDIEGCLAHLVAGTWVTAQRSLLDDLGWEKFSGPLPAWGIASDGVLFERPTPAHLTNGHAGSALLPTATAADSRASGGAAYNPANVTLTDAMVRLPTPTGPAGRNKSRSPGAAIRPSLHMINDLLPTPTSWLGRRPSHSEIGTTNSNSGTGQELVRDIAKLLGDMAE